MTDFIDDLKPPIAPLFVNFSSRCLALSCVSFCVLSILRNRVDIIFSRKDLHFLALAGRVENKRVRQCALSSVSTLPVLLHSRRKGVKKSTKLARTCQSHRARSLLLVVVLVHPFGCVKARGFCSGTGTTGFWRRGKMQFNLFLSNQQHT